VALAPILLVVLLNYLLAEIVLPQLDTSYLAQQLYGATRNSPRCAAFGRSSPRWRPRSCC
jgi:hypothetical protein